MGIPFWFSTASVTQNNKQAKNISDNITELRKRYNVQLMWKFPYMLNHIILYHPSWCCLNIPPEIKKHNIGRVEKCIALMSVHHKMQNSRLSLPFIVAWQLKWIKSENKCMSSKQRLISSYVFINPPWDLCQANIPFSLIEQKARKTLMWKIKNCTVALVMISLITSHAWLVYQF